MIKVPLSHLIKNTGTLLSSPLLTLLFCSYLSAEEESTALLDRSWAERLQYIGIALEEPDYHVWGCSPIIGSEGKTHLFVARWPVSTTFNGWYKTCEIARYTGENPEGPFRFKEVILQGSGKDTWDKRAPHNPTITKVGEQYALLYIANSGEPFPASQKIGMALSKSLEGPWEKVGTDGLILSPPDDPSVWSHNSMVGVNNPTLLHHPNGQYYLYYKAIQNGLRHMGVAISDKLEGPYLHQKDYLTNNDRIIEDGYIFMENGKIHLLTTDNEKKSGLLWSSDDGLHFSAPKLGYEPMTSYIPKDVINSSPNYRGKKFERPQLLLQDGKPTHLYLAAGVNINKGKGACSYLFKIHPQ